MAGSKRTSTQPKEWAKHLRSFGKKEFWSSVRNRFRSEEKEEMIQEINVEELKRNKEEYERDLRESLGYEKPTVDFNGDPGYEFPKEPKIFIMGRGVEEIPLPKVITIEVKGLPNTGKIMLLQLIDKALHDKFGITALCAELEDKENLCDLDNIPQHVIDAYVDRKILIEMNIKEIKEKIPFPSSLHCPCCD